MQERPLSLVTGACGFMGTHMIDVLAEAGHRIRATDLDRAWDGDDRRCGLFPSVARAAGAEIVPADLTRPETLRGLGEGVDYVFHIAAVFSYSAPWETLYRVNVEGTRHLLDALPAGRVRRLVGWGAGGVYGLPEIEGRPLVESDPPRPCNHYLRSKHLQEQAMLAADREGRVPVSILRPTGVYGPRAVYGGAQLVLGPARAPALAVPSNLTAHIPFVHVRDVCRAALHLAGRPEARGEAYNVSDDTVITIAGYLRHVARLMDVPVLPAPPLPIAPLRRAAVAVGRAGRALAGAFGRTFPIEPDSVEYFGRDFVFDNAKLRATGFAFEFPDAREGVRDTLAWYARAGWIDRAPRGASRQRWRTLAAAPADELERLMRAGRAPAEDAIAGWEFRGWSTLRATRALGLRKFKKGFYRDGRGVAGYNVAVRGGPIDEPWRPRTLGGKPIRHGFYRVRRPDAGAPYPDALLIDYGQGDNPTLDPSRVVRDYLVQPYPDEPDLLLGKAYLELGVARPAVCYFVLERDGPAAPPGEPG